MDLGYKDKVALVTGSSKGIGYAIAQKLKQEGCKVIINGTKPQDFEKSEQIVVTGQMVGSEFHASHILMKCPSKYTQDKLNVTEVKAKSASI